MTGKRPRSAFEAELQAQQSPFVTYGTPLPPLDPNVRDDGSYVPVWKQEVTDERGRKRLHGAFTGGFSAGYFNTVGSKEGWTPSTFVSSRNDRKNGAPKTSQQRPEDYMDEEDLADAAEAQTLQTGHDFAGIGSGEGLTAGRGALIDLLRTEGETMGIKLLKKMGWREGQGIGPKVRRKARLDVSEGTRSDDLAESHLFAPENTYMIKFVRKNDHKGLGFDGETRLDAHKEDDMSDNSNEEGDHFGTSVKTKTAKKKIARGGFGMGVLNDTGSDQEDPYEIGPRISYNKTIGGDKKKKKKPVSNGTVRPVFISKKNALARNAFNLRKCHDGRLPLEGFVLSTENDSMMAVISPATIYSPPDIPEGWKSAKTPAVHWNESKYVSSADAAKASKLDPNSRAKLLGEAALPGKSVFDFLSAAARDRLALASGKTNLPAALGEVPEGYAPTSAQQHKNLKNQIPQIEKDTAIAALGRGASGWMPYSEDELKRSRYRSFLEMQAGMRDGLPERAPQMSTEDWLAELREFAHCAQIFKPMTGTMATRFTSSSSAPKSTAESTVTGNESLLSKPAPKPDDPAEAAAKIGMFGPITRSTHDFFPSRLLCKRFGVKPPAHVQLDPDRADDDTNTSRGNFSTAQDGKILELVSKKAIKEILLQSGGGNLNRGTKINEGIDENRMDTTPPQELQPLEVENNDALEGVKASDAVFKAIFGDDTDESDNG